VADRRLIYTKPQGIIINKQQRKLIDNAIGRLSQFTDATSISTDALSVDSLKSALADLEATVTEIATDERDKFDNMPEGLQSSPTGERISEIADNLENLSWPDSDDFDFDTEEGREAIAEAIQDIIDEIEGAY
jgi:hypothetical protein